MISWTVAYKVLLSMKFSSGLPFPSPGDISNPGMEPGSLALQADSLPSKPQGRPVSKRYSFIYQQASGIWIAWDSDFLLLNSTVILFWSESKLYDLSSFEFVEVVKTCFMA